MQAIEFEAIAHGHTIRIPDTVPDGVQLRVLLLLEETPAAPEQPSDSPEGQALKSLLAAMPDVGDDEDFARPLDYGRNPPMPKGAGTKKIDIPQ
jgi:hypothetical protein